MTYSIAVEKKLEEKLKKILRKDKALYEATFKKIERIVKEPRFFKYLRYDLKGKQRVHILKSFVLTFYTKNTTNLLIGGQLAYNKTTLL